MRRIIAGSGKGRRLTSPRGLKTRPTSARVRQAFFDIVASHVPGCRFLDALAGSGGVGLEALSRGASSVVLVDESRTAIRAIRENLRLVPASAHVQIVCQEARLALRRLWASGARFDIVYLDPPYDSPLYEPLLEQLGDLLRERGQVVVEHFHKRPLPEKIGLLVRSREVRIGDHRLSFYRSRDEG